VTGVAVTGDAVTAVTAGTTSDETGLTGRELHAFASQLYPICRSITGAGVRRTLALIGGRVPLALREVPSGARVFDWEVPAEWNIEDACILDPHGEPVVAFKDHNLHIVSYSEPVELSLPLEELQARLHTLPAFPDWIPYRTSYYQRSWGFCLSHRRWRQLRPGRYHVQVRSRLQAGSLTYGEWYLPGRTREEVLLFTHVCHPSLANDNASGMALLPALAEWLASAPRRYSYRAVFAPGTIGSLCWLKANERRLGRVAHGLVLGLLGDSAPLTYKGSRRGDCEIDRVAAYVLADPAFGGGTMAFEPYGYDERQLCSPGFNLPVGRLTRSVNGGYPQYHSSADDLALIRPAALAQSLLACKRIVSVLEDNRRWIGTRTRGEPQLGKRGLYGSTGGGGPAQREQALLWILNQADGGASLLDIAARSGVAFDELAAAAGELARVRLLREARRTGTGTAKTVRKRR
jgi:aminopeptidase-like protein